MKKEINEMLYGAVRHIITGAGGVLMATGATSQNKTNIFAGLASFALGFVWSITHKKSVTQAIKDAAHHL